MPKVSFDYICLVVLSINSVIEKDENYYWQVFLKELKYPEKETKVIRHITGDLEIFSDDSDEE